MKRSTKGFLVTIAVLVGLAGWAWQVYGPAAEGTTGKRYGKVHRGDLLQKVTVTGQIRPFRRTIFIAPYTGYVRKIYVAVGQHIKQGDPVISVVSSLMSPEPVFPIRAPFSGTVVDVPKSEGEFVTEKDSKDIMVRVDDLSKFFVVAKAAELDAARVQIGMSVDVRVSALKDGLMKGLVR